MTPSETLRAVRRALFWLLAFGLAGMLAELLLTKHTDGALQLIPVIVLPLGLVFVLVTKRLYGRPQGAAPTNSRPQGGAPAMLVRATCVIFMLTGIVGSALHYVAKAEFALERQPDLKGLELFREALFKGTNPPLLAPGAMIVLGLLGFIWTMTMKNEYRTKNLDTITGEPQ